MPLVEITDNRNPLCIWRPYGEVYPLYPIYGSQVGTELVVKLEMVSLFEEIDVVIGEETGRPYRIAGGSFSCKVIFPPSGFMPFKGINIHSSRLFNS